MSGRLIVITGATRGLGRALVAEFTAAGHTVAGCGRDPAGVAQMQQRYPAPHVFTAVDVADDSAVRTWAGQVLARLGPPDLLINNAAIMTPLAPLWEVPAKEFDTLVAVNISGVANVIRHFVPAMVVRKMGIIVNLSSGWGRSTAPEVAPYCASKYAVEGLSKSLAQELPSGMASIPLNPGIIDTDMLRQAWADGASAYPKAEAWARTAAPMILCFSGKDNGKSLSVS